MIDHHAAQIRRPLKQKKIWNRKMKRRFILYICSLKWMNQQKKQKKYWAVWRVFKPKGQNL